MNNAVGCVAHYRMNDNATSTAVIDETGDHHGVYKSVGGNANTADHDVTGLINSALDFVGDDDYVEVADHADFTPTSTGFSISAIVNMDDATNFIIAGKHATGKREWIFHCDSNDKIMFRMYNESTGALISRYYNTALGTSHQGKWAHFVGTYDGKKASTGIKIYLDGIKVDDTTSESGSFDSVENLAEPVWIGRNGASYANGKIDNLMIFNRELTGDEAIALSNTGSGLAHLPELDDIEQFTRTLRRR